MTTFSSRRSKFCFFSLNKNKLFFFFFIYTLQEKFALLLLSVLLQRLYEIFWITRRKISQRQRQLIDLKTFFSHKIYIEFTELPPPLFPIKQTSFLISSMLVLNKYSVFLLELFFVLLFFLELLKRTHLILCYYEKNIMLHQTEF